MFDTTVTLALAVIAIILSVLFHKYKSRSSEKRMTKMMRHIYAQKKPRRKLDCFGKRITQKIDCRKFHGTVSFVPVAIIGMK